MPVEVRLLPVALLTLTLAGCMDQGEDDTRRDGEVGTSNDYDDCTSQGGTRMDGGGCAVPLTQTTTSSQPACTSQTGSTTPSPGGWCPPPSQASPCEAATPCEIPSVDANPLILVVANATYESGDLAPIRLRNLGNRTYTYSWTQASCELGIYSETGRKLSMGVCSDYYTSGRLPPGGDVDYWTWEFQECNAGGPWYGGCDHWTPVPVGVYHLRQTFCAAASSTSSSTSGPGDCTRTGTTIELVDGP